MIPVYKKELKQYLYSVTGSIFISVNLFVLGLYFLAGNLLGMTPSLSPVISGVLFILMLMVPVISMRVMAEERRQKTDQLLLTSPVSVYGLVIGKYLALLTVFLVPVLVACLMPLIMSAFGKVAYAESYTAILGYFLYGAACLALGLAISTVTESQVIAAVLSFIALFTTYIMGGIVSMLTRSGNKLFQVLSVLDFSSKLENFMNGVLDLKEIVYFLSIILFFLFLSVQLIEKRRYSVSKKNLSLSAYSLVSVFVMAALVILLNFGMEKLPVKYSEFDMTEGALFTLDAKTVDFLKTLDKDVTVYVMGTKENLENYDYKEVEKTLDQFCENSGHFHVIYKDPAVEPDFAKKYTDDNVSIGSLIVVSGEKSRVLSPYSLYKTEVDYSTYSEQRTGYDGEGQIVSAVTLVTGGDLPKVYCLTGHEELDIGDLPELKASLDKMNLEVESLNLMQEKEVPEDAEALMILSPSKDLHEDDVKAVSDYLDNGGKAVITADFSGKEQPGFDSLLSKYGVERVNGIIVEGDEYNMYQSPVYLIPEANTSVLTGSIIGKGLLNLFPQSAGFKTETKEGLEIEEALVTSEMAYAKTSVTENTSVEKADGDEEGPFDLALYINDESGKGTLALFGTANIFAAEVDQRVGGANTELFTNALDSMIDNTLTVTIPAKSYNTAALTVPYGSAMILGFLFIIVIPLAVLIAGIMLHMSRKRK